MKDSAKFHPTAFVEEGTIINDEALIDAFSCIGVSPSYAIPCKPPRGPAIIETGANIGRHVTICEGAQIGTRAKIDDYCRIGQNSIIGNECIILYGAQIFHKVEIGSKSRIAGFVSSRVVIGKNVTSMGSIIHKYSQPFEEWDSIEEPSPQIEDFVVIGMGAVIVGGIVIGKHSYIAANATVTISVPPHSVVIGINNIIPKDKWKGSLRYEHWWLAQQTQHKPER